MNQPNGTPLDTYARRIEELEREAGILSREKEDLDKMLGAKMRHVDTLAAMVDRLERQLEEAREIFTGWCSVPWQHKTPEMLSRYKAWLKEVDGE